ncbi:MAG: TonB-dependent receptor [Bryobacterales bacterium]|nr:TonB-dependent receptor [Bryobacterales bacterium]
MRLALLAALLVPTLFAQSTALLNGTVEDTTGAVIAQANLTATEQRTSLRHTATSDEAGRFNFPRLPIGNYVIECQVQGFRRFVSQPIRLDADQTRTAQIVLQVGDTAESIEVGGSIGLVETVGATIRETVDEKRITELPLNGRNPLQLQLLLPGVVPSVGGANLAQNGTITMNGARGTSNNYMLDGGDNNDPQISVAALVPNPDALEEFSILTNNYSAEYGRNAGGVVNAITKAGTNTLHGSAYEFVRNDAMDARNFFSLVQQKLRRNQFGASVGGPLILPKLYNGKDRTFFFFSYEGVRQRTGRTVSNLIVPTAAERAGDFSLSARKPTDPVTRQPFPGNVIPASRFDPAAARFLELLVPLPNAPNNAHIYNPPESLNSNQVIARGDHSFNTNHRVSLRFFNDRSTALAVAGLPILQSDVKFNTYNAMANYTWVISPATLNTVQFTTNRTDLARGPLPIGDGLNYEKLGVRAASDTPQFPTNWRGQVSGFWNMNQDNYVTIDRKTYQLLDNFTWTRGAHLMKFGGEFRRTMSDRETANLTDPQFTFDGRFAVNPFADFLLGLPARMDQGSIRVNAVRSDAIAFYFQDDWKVRNNLTLSIGMRWEPLLPFYDGRDQLSVFRPGVQSTIFPTAPAGLLYVGDPGVPRAGIPNDWNNWGPRFGFAWSPFKKGKTSVRGGYGVFYDFPVMHQLSSFANTQPFSVQVQVNQPPSFSNPYGSGRSPFPYQPPTTPEARRAFNFVRPVVVGESLDPNLGAAYMQQWNFNIQQETVNGIVLTAAYVGSKGTGFSTLRNLNAAIPAPNGTGANIEQRRPYLPGVLGSISSYDPLGFSTYHALQLTLNKRFAKHYTLLANYTYAKSIDNGSVDAFGGAQDQRNWSAEKGLSDFDLRHRLVTSFLAELPGPKSGPAKWILGGWQVNGIFAINSGRPVNIVSGTDRAFTGAGTQRPNLIGDPVLDPNRSRADLITRYFNPAAFALPAVGTFGNSGRNTLIGPGSYNLDSSLFRMFTLRERLKLQFRAEFFNTFNNPNFGGLVANISAPNAGRLQTATDPRILQFGLRLVW